MKNLVFSIGVIFVIAGHLSAQSDSPRIVHPEAKTSRSENASEHGLFGSIDIPVKVTRLPFPIELQDALVLQNPRDERLLLGYSIRNAGDEDVVSHAARAHFYDSRGNMVGFQTVVSRRPIPAGSERSFSMELPTELGAQGSVLVTPFRIGLAGMRWSADIQELGRVVSQFGQTQDPLPFFHWKLVFEDTDITPQQCAPPCNANEFCNMERQRCIGQCGQGGIKEFSCTISCTECSSKCTCFGKN
jgi:hypothetical protein